MNRNYKDVRATAQMRIQALVQEGATALTSELIRAEVKAVIAFWQARDVDADALVADLESSFQTVIGRERFLVGDRDGYEPWLESRKGEISWRFWDRYEQFLLREKGWAGTTLRRLDESTDRVLGLLTDPKRPGAWDRRGLVVGHVQSGKTSHYIGLISKAADAGYKLVVVLAGFHKSLRSQTQIRLEEGFLGYDRGATQFATEAPMQRVGVGLIDPTPKADSITTRADNGDFKRQVANHFSINPGGHPLLFVVKKNNSVLNNLLKWVAWAANATDESDRRYVAGVPLLVIDDEADQGSIDTRRQEYDEDGRPDPEHDPVAINRSIRRLLYLFGQSAYVGYTATPFANIFIHERNETKTEGADLFPRSFIVSLPVPSNHIGPTRVFESSRGEEGATGLPIVRVVTDHADSLDPNERSGWMPPKHDKQHKPLSAGQDQAPDSLRNAIYAFLLTIAARRARGQENQHNSMLVHVTRFTAVQGIVAEQVRSILVDAQRRLRVGDGDAPDQILHRLRKLWENDFVPTTRKVQAFAPDQSIAERRWEDVVRQLPAAAQSVKVRAINGMAGEVLDYVDHAATGLNVIAVGGDKLSRGLTLEGLSVSYFLRASRMYDTLMQMGRWFGYRPGYLDLCRLYTTPDMKDWFGHIADASEELLDDFERMAASHQTPRDFGHRVRSHPLMMVTSQVKMRSGQEFDITFAGDISETINFWRDEAHLAANWSAARQLVAEIERHGAKPSTPGGRGSRSALWREVKAVEVLNFLALYQEHPASRRVKTRLLADYITAENARGFLREWTVLLASGQHKSTCTLGSATVSRVERAWHLSSSASDGDSRIRELREYQQENHFRVRRLVSPSDESVDLTGPELERARRLTIEAWEADPDRRGEAPTVASGVFIREARSAERGLLMLYPLDGGGLQGEEKAEPAVSVPILGFAISFPAGDRATASRVRYVVNNVYLEQELLGLGVPIE